MATPPACSSSRTRRARGSGSRGRARSRASASVRSSDGRRKPRARTRRTACVKPVGRGAVRGSEPSVTTRRIFAAAPRDQLRDVERQQPALAVADTRSTCAAPVAARTWSMNCHDLGRAGVEARGAHARDLRGDDVGGLEHERRRDAAVVQREHAVAGVGQVRPEEAPVRVPVAARAVDQDDRVRVGGRGHAGEVVDPRRGLGRVLQRDEPQEGGVADLLERLLLVRPRCADRRDLADDRADDESEGGDDLGERAGGSHGRRP